MLGDARFVTVEFQGAIGERQTLTVMGMDDGGFWGLYSTDDPLFEGMFHNGLITLRNRDGKIIQPGDMTLHDWMNLLQLDYGPVVVLDGEVPELELTDPQDEVER